jgi:GH15 family glucan-1,4-alpha-glucosidase
VGRPVILGNGSLTVGLNEQGLVHDFYYPYVGLDNLNTSRSVHHKIGVWVDGEFSWVDDDSWDIQVNLEADALVSNIVMRSDKLNVELAFNDFVDHEFNAFCRQITITNKNDDYRNIRIFTHQVFEISRRGRADTALFIPDDNYVLDYKGRCCLLVYGQSVEGAAFDQFAVGNFGIEGKEGTYKDAEDGELSGNAVEHGGVDSILRFPCSLSAGASTQLDYYVIAADSQYNGEKILTQLKKEGLDERIDKTRHYWNEWLNIGSNGLHLVDKKHLDIAKKSLMVIKAHTDKRGGIIASCDSSIYNFGRDYYSYVWPRDGAYAMWPLIRLGYTEEPKRFFEFCRDILTHDGFLMHKYQPDRAIGSTWHPLLHGNHKELAIQEDETAIVLYMLGEYFNHSKDQDFVFGLYNTLIQPAANFMADFIDEATQLPHASYDLWEEKFLTNTYTAALVYQGLLTAAEFADTFEYPDDAVQWRNAAATILEGSHVFFDTERQAYRKGFLLQEDGSLSFDNTLDVSSLYGAMMFGLHDFNTDEISHTLEAIENILLDKSPSGGCPRYEYDHYFESDPAYVGNPWFVTTLWLAQYYVRAGQVDKARHYVEWTTQHTLQSGMLSEQINPSDSTPLSVTPLVWSHAELVNTLLDLSKVGN